MKRARLTACVLAALAGALGAQGGVAPETSTDHWGWTALDQPLGRSWTRYQLLIPRTTLPPTLTAGKTITAIGLRRAALPGGAYAAVSIDTEIAMHDTAQPLPAFSQTFATNRATASAGGIVFTRKQLNLPAADFGNPDDFLVIPLDTPHVFAGPHLLLEFSNRAAVAQTNGWRVDAVGARELGASTTFGKACGAHRNDTSIASPGGLRPGTTATVTLSNAPPNGATALMTGLSAIGFSGIPLPLDTSFFMPQGCRLMVSIDATLTRGIDASGTSQIVLRIPADLALNNIVYYLQWILVDAQATQLEFSAAQQIHVGPVTRVMSASTLRPNDDADTTGEPIVRDLMPVVLLRF